MVARRDVSVCDTANGLGRLSLEYKKLGIKMNTQEIIKAVSDAADPMTPTSEGAYTATEALALTSDYAQLPTEANPTTRVVSVSHPDAMVLLVAEGGKLPRELAESLGLKAKKDGTLSAPAAPIASE
jgi:hypothetical protein